MAKRTSTCPQCGAQFPTPRPSKPQVYCSKVCGAAPRKRHDRNCAAAGCDKDVRSGRYCSAHEARLRRTGRLDLAPPPRTREHSNGYVLVWAPDHPLRVGKSGPREYEHRVVFYDEHGEGPFRCHWCGVRVSWSDMDVDHVNTKRDDNTIGNLVASCPPCNVNRGRDAMVATSRAKRATMLTVKGVTKPVVEWAEAIGIDRVSLKARLKAGWPPERAVTELRGRFGPRAR